MICVSQAIKPIPLTSKFALPVHYSNIRKLLTLQTLSFSKEIVFPWFDNVLAISLNQKLPNLQNTECKSYTLAAAAHTGNAKIANLWFRCRSEVRQDLSVTLKSHPRHCKVLLYSRHCGLPAVWPCNDGTLLQNSFLFAYGQSFTGSAARPVPLWPVITSLDGEKVDATPWQNRVAETVVFEQKSELLSSQISLSATWATFQTVTSHLEQTPAQQATFIKLSGRETPWHQKLHFLPC